MGIKGISSTFELSRNTVRKYVRKFLDSGETLLSMDENRLQEIFMAGHPRHREPSENVKQLEALLPE